MNALRLIVFSCIPLAGLGCGFQEVPAEPATSSTSSSSPATGDAGSIGSDTGVDSGAGTADTGAEPGQLADSGADTGPLGLDTAPDTGSAGMDAAGDPDSGSGDSGTIDSSGDAPLDETEARFAACEGLQEGDECTWDTVDGPRRGTCQPAPDGGGRLGCGRPRS